MWRQQQEAANSQWVRVVWDNNIQNIVLSWVTSTDSGGGGVSSSRWMRRAEWKRVQEKAFETFEFCDKWNEAFLDIWSIVLIVTSKSVRTSYIPLLRKCDRGREASFCYAWIDKLDREEGARHGASKHFVMGGLSFNPTAYNLVEPSLAIIHCEWVGHRSDQSIFQLIMISAGISSMVTIGLKYRRSNCITSSKWSTVWLSIVGFLFTNRIFPRK